MHDLRNAGDHPPQSPKHWPSRADKKWEHDLYNEVMQAPKFSDEIMRRYGNGNGIKVNIRAVGCS
uniref:Uncharacterized protein n=1 Tax=Parascaris univalens TaxID=6257 RepID=A0A915A351_PARUN